MGASTTRPADHTGLVLFRVTRDPDEADGEPREPEKISEEAKDAIYLKFQVQDTGKGLTDSEVKMLFQRFNQATPKTHVQYGGSGKIYLLFKPAHILIVSRSGAIYLQGASPSSRWRDWCQFRGW